MGIQNSPTGRSPQRKGSLSTRCEVKAKIFPSPFCQGIMWQPKQERAWSIQPAPTGLKIISWAKIWPVSDFCVFVCRSACLHSQSSNHWSFRPTRGPFKPYENSPQLSPILGA
jgi:hypothetical protein